MIGMMQMLVPIQMEEGFPTFSAFSCFFFILSSYYLLLPLRDEVGLLMGEKVWEMV